MLDNSQCGTQIGGNRTYSKCYEAVHASIQGSLEHSHAQYTSCNPILCCWHSAALTSGRYTTFAILASPPAAPPDIRHNRDHHTARAQPIEPTPPVSARDGCYIRDPCHLFARGTRVAGWWADIMLSALGLRPCPTDGPRALALSSAPGPSPRARHPHQHLAGQLSWPAERRSSPAPRAARRSPQAAAAARDGPGWNSSRCCHTLGRRGGQAVAPACLPAGTTVRVDGRHRLDQEPMRAAAAAPSPSSLQP